jgi:hypothetical protein
LKTARAWETVTAVCMVARNLGARYSQHGAPNHERRSNRERGIADDCLAVEFGSVTALEICEDEGTCVNVQPSMLARNVAIEGDTRLGDRVISPDRDFPVELPGFTVERATENLEQVHGSQAFEGAGEYLLCEKRATSKHNANKSPEPDDYS